MRTLLQTTPRAAGRHLARAASVAAALCLCLALCALLAPAAAAQTRTEYRAFWVDTFNTTLNNHADVVAVVNNAKAAKANAIFAQVRRRGDAWYLNSVEPRPDFTPIAAGFDPLQDLIAEAHANGIEVHAFVIMSAIWSKNPNFAPSATLGPPTSPSHPFNLHGGYNPATQQIVPGPDNWLTRTLLADNAAAQISFQGHRFGSDFWIDFGHPDAAAYTVEVVKRLVANYDIDGLHLDRIRYPEINVTGQTPTSGVSIGYNATSVARFQRRNNIAEGSAPPAQNNGLWSQWRRDQVTNVVRRVYLESLALKPDLKISAALIAFGAGPTTEASWNNAEARWRVYQDWRAWTEEGIIDIAIPMVYKGEHTPALVTQFNQWNEWTKNHQYNRGAMIGIGGANNSIEGTLRQTRRALLAPSAQGKTDLGVIYFSMATSNIAVTNNPLAIPAGTTPARPFAEFAAGLVTGGSADGTRRYEAAGLTPVFSEAANIPELSWKTQPALGHAKGFAVVGGTPLDTAAVTIERLDADAPARTTATDGGGFYGAIDLAPGRYRATAELGPDKHRACFDVTAGRVADAAPDAAAPETSALLSPAAPAGANGWHTADVTVALDAADDCAGVASTEYSTDGGSTWRPYAGAFVVSQEGATVVSFRSTDAAGNAEAAKSLTVLLDKSAPTVSLSADPATLWPANGETVQVTISGAGADTASGLAGVSYVVTDEYGTPLSVAPRALSGAQSTWAESLGLEARRDGGDRDGRVYRVTATVTDAAGHTATATTTILVPHDRRSN